MVPAKKLAAILGITLVAGALSTATAIAQVNPGNPSGGTFIRPALPESSPTFAPSTLGTGVSLDAVLRQWAATLALRQIGTTPLPLADRSVRAYKSRKLARR